MKIFSATHDFDYTWEEVSTANWRKYCPWNHESSHVIAVDTLSRRVDAETGILRTERLITCKQAAPRWIKPLLGNAEVSYVYEVSYVTPPASSTLRSATSLASSTTSTNSASSASSINPSSFAIPASNNQPSPPQTKTTYFFRRPKPTAQPKQAQNAQPSTAAPILASSAAQSGSFNTPATDPLQKSISLQTPKVVMTSQNLTWSDLLSVRETVVYEPSPDSPGTQTRFKQNAEITALCGGWAKVKQKIEEFTVERFGQNAERGKKGFEEVLEMSRKVFGEEKAKERLAAGA